ncbi:MFS transporter [Streptomyces seoulensis]|uniref:MFS transporter n=1 Tax=Streptomyces seoulensis TaxID=73044 RepID=UPI003F4B4840
MLILVTAVHTASAPALIISALLADTGQGMGQLGGLSLLNTVVPPHRLAEANAALNIGGYLPAGLLPVLTGYLSATTLFGATLAALAIVGALTVRTSKPHLTDPARQKLHPPRSSRPRARLPPPAAGHPVPLSPYNRRPGTRRIP